jgi:hypothetical protein
MSLELCFIPKPWQVLSLTPDPQFLAILSVICKTASALPFRQRIRFAREQRACCFVSFNQLVFCFVGQRPVCRNGYETSKCFLSSSEYCGSNNVWKRIVRRCDEHYNEFRYRSNCNCGLRGTCFVAQYFPKLESANHGNAQGPVSI